MKCPTIVRQIVNDCGALFMTKYSSEFKIMVVSEYHNGGISKRELAKKYQIPSRAGLQLWIKQAETQGIDSLIVKHTNREYSSDFKLRVVEYVKTHEASQQSVAVLFGISPSQVASWLSRYKHKGVAGLRAKPQGRSSAMPKKKKRTQLSSTKEERYKQKILELKQELYETKMDRDILKTLATITARNLAKSRIK